MSDWLIIAGIPAMLLAFYPLVISLARLRPLRINSLLLMRLHIGGWGLTLLLFIGFLNWRVSLRGQWLDVLPFGVAWLAAGIYFWGCRRQLSWPGKLYFGGWFGYPAALALAYMADKLFFALVAFPLFAFLPATTYYSSPNVTLRDSVSGLLSAKRVQLLTPISLVFEKHEGLTADALLTADNNVIINVKLQPSWRPDSVAAVITTRQGQRLVKFGR